LEKRGKYVLATIFIRLQPFLDYMSINHLSLAAVNKKLMDWKFVRGGDDHSGEEANNRE